MTEKEAGSEPAPGRPPRAPLPGDGMEPAPRVAAGVFLIGCGLCFVFGGGGCTTLSFAVMPNPYAAPRLLGALFPPAAILVVGIVAVVFGIRDEPQAMSEPPEGIHAA